MANVRLSPTEVDSLIQALRYRVGRDVNSTPAKDAALRALANKLLSVYPTLEIVALATETTEIQDPVETATKEQTQ